MFELFQDYAAGTETIALMVTALNVIIHIIFAGAVAKDAGNLFKVGDKTLLVSGLTWAFATLIGGVFIAIAYWLMHHSKFTRT